MAVPQEVKPRTNITRVVRSVTAALGPDAAPSMSTSQGSDQTHDRLVARSSSASKLPSLLEFSAGDDMTLEEIS